MKRVRWKNLKTVWAAAKMVFSSKRYAIFAYAEEEGGDPETYDATISFCYTGIKGEIPMEYLKTAVSVLEQEAITKSEIIEMTTTEAQDAK